MSDERETGNELVAASKSMHPPRAFTMPAGCAFASGKVRELSGREFMLVGKTQGDAFAALREHAALSIVEIDGAPVDYDGVKVHMQGWTERTWRAVNRLLNITSGAEQLESHSFFQEG